MREYKGQQFTAMVLEGNSGIRVEDTELPAERTGTRKRATWKKKKTFRDHSVTNYCIVWDCECKANLGGNPLRNQE